MRRQLFSEVNNSEGIKHFQKAYRKQVFLQRVANTLKVSAFLSLRRILRIAGAPMISSPLCEQENTESRLYRPGSHYQLMTQHWFVLRLRWVSHLTFMNLLISYVWPLRSSSYLWETLSHLLGDFESYCNLANGWAWWFHLSSRFHCLWVWLSVTHIPRENRPLMNGKLFYIRMAWMQMVRK